MENIEKIFYSELLYGRCNLCLEENIQIMLYPDHGNLLNYRCDLIARYLPKTEFRLFKSN